MAQIVKTEQASRHAVDPEVLLAAIERELDAPVHRRRTRQRSRWSDRPMTFAPLVDADARQYGLVRFAEVRVGDILPKGHQVVGVEPCGVVTDVALAGIEGWKTFPSDARIEVAR